MYQLIIVYIISQLFSSLNTSPIPKHNVSLYANSSINISMLCTWHLIVTNLWFTAIYRGEICPSRQVMNQSDVTVWNTFQNTIHHSIDISMFQIHSLANLWFTAIYRGETCPSPQVMNQSNVDCLKQNTIYLTMPRLTLSLTKPLFHRYSEGIPSLPTCREHGPIVNLTHIT